MLTDLSNFTSVFEVSVGVHFIFTFFYSVFEIRSSKIQKIIGDLESEISDISARGINTNLISSELYLLKKEKIDFDWYHANILEKISFFSVAVAIWSAGILVWSGFNPHFQTSVFNIGLLLFVSIAPVPILGIVFKVTIRRKIMPIQKKHMEIVTDLIKLRGN